MTDATTPRDLPAPGLEADERTTLLTFLDYLREAVIAKAEGLSEEAARTPGVPSGTSLLGLLKHLAATEDNWLTWSYAGEGERMDSFAPPLAGESVADVVAAYRAAGARSDAVARGCTDLDLPGARSLRGTAAPTMRWILVHMVEETARHAGHADILREQIDGAVGR